MLAIIVSIVFIGIIVGMGAMVYVQLKKTDPSKADSSVRDDITTAQEFLAFEDIKDGMICLGGHQYRAVIECSSTNYNLKTEREKEMIEIAFQRFVNSLSHPIVFYVQTRVIDNSKMLELLKEEIEKTVEHFPQLKQYGDIFFQEMENLNVYVGNNKQKKKYIIVPYDEAVNLPNLSESEKYEFARKELYNRASIIVDGLSAVGVKAHILNTKELAEMVFAAYHKDNYTHVDNVTNGEFLTLLTEGENKIQKLPFDARLDWILYEAQMRIQSELMSSQAPDFLKNNFEKCLSELNRLREQVGGYFKQRVEDEEESLTKDDLERFLQLEKEKEEEIV